jgi:hypothetical protein
VHCSLQVANLAHTVAGLVVEQRAALYRFGVQLENLLRITQAGRQVCLAGKNRIGSLQNVFKGVLELGRHICLAED